MASKKLLTTNGPTDRPLEPELENATFLLDEAKLKGQLKGFTLRVRTIRSKGGQIRREFWAHCKVTPEPGNGKSHKARARRKAVK